jgi:signal transduction histidine kinase
VIEGGAEPTFVAPDWRARFHGDGRVRVDAGDLGEAPAQVLGLRRSGRAWICDRRETLATVDQVRHALVPSRVVHGYDDPRTGRRELEFTFEAAPGDGAPESISVRCRDVTARRAHLRALEREGALLATLEEGVVLVDAGGEVALASPAAVRLLGRGDPVGRRLVDVAGPLAAALEGAAGGAPVRVELPPGTGVAATVIEARTRTLDADPGMRLLVLRDPRPHERLEQSILDAERRERERLARDLHDGVGQELTAVTLLLKALARSLAGDRPEAAAELEALVGTVGGVLAATRTLARELFEPALPPGGLPAALEALATRVDQALGPGGPRVRFQATLAMPVSLEPAACRELLRIAQECLTNALRHAEASHVGVELASDGDGLTLTVADDGRGFRDPRDSGHGAGLSIVRQRACAIGAEFLLATAPGRGTRASCVLRRRAAAES